MLYESYCAKCLHFLCVLFLYYNVIWGQRGINLSANGNVETTEHNISEEVNSMIWRLLRADKAKPPGGILFCCPGICCLIIGEPFGFSFRTVWNYFGHLFSSHEHSQQLSINIWDFCDCYLISVAHCGVSTPLKYSLRENSSSFHRFPQLLPLLPHRPSIISSLSLCCNIEHVVWQIGHELQKGNNGEGLIVSVVWITPLSFTLRPKVYVAIHG